jgi:hypothetical protein
MTETGLTTRAAFVMIERIMSRLHPDADANCIFFGGNGEQGVGYVDFNGIESGTADAGHVVSGLLAVIESLRQANPEIYDLFMTSIQAKVSTLGRVIPADEVLDYMAGCAESADSD